MGKILFIRGGALGDFVLTLPTIRLLRSSLAGNRYELLAQPQMGDLAVAAGYFEHHRPLEHGGLATFFARPIGALDDSWSAYFQDFDLIISYLFDPDGFFEHNLQRAKARSVLVGPHKPKNDGTHAASQLAAPLETLALFLDDLAPTLPLHGTLRSTWDADRVVIHPGSGSVSKNWPMGNWAEVGKRLAGEGKTLLLISGEAEETWINQLIREWQSSEVPFSHAHHWPLAMLMEEISKCAFFLGHDSGVSHLAAATGLPCLLLFGPSDPLVWCPANPGVKIVEAKCGDLSRLAIAQVWPHIQEMIETTKNQSD